MFCPDHLPGSRSCGGRDVLRDRPQKRRHLAGNCGNGGASGCGMTPTEIVGLPDAELPGGLTDADLRGCRFIKGPATPLKHGMFCGATPTEPGGSWCGAHRTVVYRIAVRRPEAPNPSLY